MLGAGTMICDYLTLQYSSLLNTLFTIRFLNTPLTSQLEQEYEAGQRNKQKLPLRSESLLGDKLQNTADTDYKQHLPIPVPDWTYLELPPTVRFSATIHTRRKAESQLDGKLDIDRVPDPKGLVRALVTAADCVRLLNQGLEVHLHQAYPVQPLKSCVD